MTGLHRVVTAVLPPRRDCQLNVYNVARTNGILLHIHDQRKPREAGLTSLSVSIDSSDPDIYRNLRGGTSIAKVSRNLVEFSKQCPGVGISFITTVTRLNVPALPELVRFGLDLGVSRFCFREVF